MTRELGQDFDRLYQYVDENIGKLIEIYGGRFVMVYDNRVVDSDSDFLKLSIRHQRRYNFDFDRNRAALITQIPKTIEECEENRKIYEQPPSYPAFESPE